MLIISTVCIGESAMRNVWKLILSIGTGKYKLNYKVTLTWDDYVYNLREYCQKRTMWLSDHLAPGVKIDTYQIYPAGTK